MQTAAGGSKQGSGQGSGHLAVGREVLEESDHLRVAVRVLLLHPGHKARGVRPATPGSACDREYQTKEMINPV